MTGNQHLEAELRAQAAYWKAEMNKAYAERNRLVAALSKAHPSHLARHEGDDWEIDWRWLVCIHLPTGQATWHIHDSELELMTHLAAQPGHWDGHSTEEKYERLARVRELTP